MSIWNNLLQAILEVALPILVSAAAVWLVGKAKEVFQKLKEERPETYYILAALAEKVVEAAEQIYAGQGRGKEKKDYAIKLLETYLKSRGVDLDLRIIDAYIEAEVHKLNLLKDMENNDADVPTAIQQ